VDIGSLPGVIFQLPVTNRAAPQVQLIIMASRPVGRASWPARPLAWRTVVFRPRASWPARPLAWRQRSALRYSEAAAVSGFGVSSASHRLAVR
jgi:hypothetical protein